MPTVFHTLTVDNECIYCKQCFDTESAKKEHENERKYWDNFKSGDKGNYLGCHQILKTTDSIIVPSSPSFTEKETVRHHSGEERTLFTVQQYAKYSTPKEAMLAYMDNDEEGWLEIPLEDGRFLQLIDSGDWQVVDTSCLQHLSRK